MYININDILFIKVNLLANFTVTLYTDHFIKPFRDPVHKSTWISVRFYEMGDCCDQESKIYYTKNKFRYLAHYL